MKFIYKLMIVSVLCLLSNTVNAQISQYTENGKKACLDCEEKSNTSIESCFCLGIFQLKLFEYYMPSTNGSIKDEWLKNQEKLLTKAMDGSVQQNFNEVQKAYFRDKETDKLAATYYDKILKHFNEPTGYNENELNNATTNYTVLNYRSSIGASSSSLFGDLMFNGKILSRLSSHELIVEITKERQKRDAQRKAYESTRLNKTVFDLHVNDGKFSKFLADKYIRHYNNLGHEDAVRFMTRYMIAINSNHYPYVYEPFGNLHNIFSLEGKDYLNELIDNLTWYGDWTANVPPVNWTTPSNDQALFDFAINSNSAMSFETKDKQFIASHPEFEAQLKKHFEANNYGFYSMSYPNTTITQFLENYTSTIYQRFEKLVIPNAPFSFFDAGNNRMMVHGFKLKNEAGESNTFSRNKKGFSNILAELFKHNITNQQYALEGSLMRAYLKGGQFSIAASVSDEDLGRFFDFGYVAYNTSNESTIPLTLANSYSGSRDFGILAMEAFLNGGEVDFDDEIIFDQNVNDCVLEIIRKLQLKDTHASVNPDIPNGGNEHIAQVILDLFDNDPTYNLRFSIEVPRDVETNEPLPNANGQHKFIFETSTMLIRINPKLVEKGTDLHIAKTIIHESIHAWIKYKFKTLSKTFALTLRDLHEKMRKEHPEIAGLTEHEFMGQIHSALAQSLAAWDFHKKTDEYYNQISWGGLEATSFYKAFTQKEKDKIQEILKNERTGNSKALGERCPE